MPNCFLISVDKPSKKAYYFLIRLKCFLISVDRAFILVFWANKNVYCFLKMRELLSHSSNSRTHDNYSYVAKAIADLPEFSQADQYVRFLK